VAKGILRTIERRGKRLLIRLASRLVRTTRMSADEVRAARPRRVLVVRQHNQMGDMLLAVPAYRAIKETLPDVVLGVVTAPINRGVLLNNPFVDFVYTYNNRDPFAACRMIREIRRRRFDLVIVLHTVSFSFTSALIGLLSGARVRAGSASGPFGNELSAAFYHLELPLPSPGDLARMNEAEHNLYPLRAMGIDTADLSPLFVPTAEDRAFAREFTARTNAPGRRRIVVHPGAGKAQNVWSPEKFAEVANRLGGEFDLDLCVLKGPRDERHVRAFARVARVPYAVLEGRSVGEVAAVLEKADLVLCNDTGIMHLSSAVNAATLAIFGPTDPARWAPRCANLRVVRPTDGDLLRLEVDAVVERATDALRSEDGAKGDLER
jgi:ADP-heptose:LPS heptosyltransferase